jgi:hypothetical protein
MGNNRIGAPSAGTIGAHAAPAPAPSTTPAAGTAARPARAAVTGPLAHLAPSARAGNAGGAGAAPRQLRPPPRATPGAGGDIAAMQAMAHATMAAQNAMAVIQNQIAVNQAKNQVVEELGKGLKSLAQ